MSRDQSALLPAAVDVAFRKRRCAGHPGDFRAGYWDYSVALDELSLSDPTAPRVLSGVSVGAPGTPIPTTKSIRSTALALFNPPGGNPTNQASLAALATRIAQDFYDWSSQPSDVVYNGVVVPDKVGLVDYFEIDQFSTGISTRVVSGAWSGYPEELQQNDPANAACVGASGAVSQDPCWEMYGPIGQVVGAGNIGWERKTVCLEAGRLVEKHLGNDVLNCACAPTTSTVGFGATLCTDGTLGLPLCCPSPTIPVTVQVTQTVGGSYTGSCTITTCGNNACTLVLPLPPPGQPDNVFTVQWSASGWNTATETLNLAPGETSTSIGATLTRPTGQFCLPPVPYFGTPPANLTVTLSSGTALGDCPCCDENEYDGPDGEQTNAAAICPGTYTVPFQGLTVDGTNATWSADLTTACPVGHTGPPFYHLGFDISIFLNTDCSIGYGVGLTYQGEVCPCEPGPEFGVDFMIVSGTLINPIAFTAVGTTAGGCQLTLAVSQ